MEPEAMKASVLLLLMISTAAFAQDTGLLRCRGIADASARLACYDALPIPPAEAKAAPQKPEQFGLEYKQEQKAQKLQLQEVDSTIAGRFEGWGPKSLIRLANGQVWQVTDDTSRITRLDNPKVKIRRGMLGAFYLEIEGDNRSPRVRRVE